MRSLVNSMVTIPCLSAFLLLIVPQSVLLGGNFRIAKQGESWQLLCDDQPFYIKGAVGWRHFDVLRRCGGNAVRSRARKELLDQAHTHQLKVMAGLPVQGERNGMDWGDAKQVEEQKLEVIEVVKQLKDHPALMLWVVGNELDWIPPGRPHHPQLWQRLNDLAVAIKQVDPHHPVLTVVGTGRFDTKIQEIAAEMPDIDLLGINAYGDISKVVQSAERHWPRPFLIAEWGPTGHWQVAKTRWRVPLEETSSQKAAAIRSRYENVIQKADRQCLGSFVFLWGQKQETTHTWYGMFQGDLQTESVDVMQRMWTGSYPENRAPSLADLVIAGHEDTTSVYLKPSTRYRASVRCSDPDGDPLEYHWEIRPEVEIPAASYAGSMEKAAQPISGLVLIPQQDQVAFNTPESPGPYRLFVRVLDGHQHVAYGNIPFFVQ